MVKEILRTMLITIHNQLGQIRKPERLESWLCPIAIDAIGVHCQTRKIPELSQIALPEDEMDAITVAFCQIVRCLPKIYSTALLLTECKGLTQKELAERLGMSYSGAKSRVQRGRDKLKQLLRDCCQMGIGRSQVVGAAMCRPGLSGSPSTLWRVQSVNPISLNGGGT
jgi:RNA polymerase sigma-70 factor, ECF subfamily